jgi:molybdate transport system substrate-binding protein
MPRCVRALLVTALALLGAVRASAAQPRADAVVTVAVAANLKPAFERIAAAFRARNPSVQVRASYGASGSFFSQIEHGAPFDLFLSADAELTDRLAKAGLTDGPPFTYARGALVLWVPGGSSLPIERDGLAALRAPAVRKIAIANPRAAPYGRAAEEALAAARLLETVRPKLVLGQSAAQTAQFAQAGAADAAFLPLSLVRAPPLSSEGRYIPVPEHTYAPIEQTGAVLRASRRPVQARALAEFVRGSEAREVLESFGYTVPAR